MKWGALEKSLATKLGCVPGIMSKSTELAIDPEPIRKAQELFARRLT
jgi:hypothetical protein